MKPCLSWMMQFTVDCDRPSSIDRRLNLIESFLLEWSGVVAMTMKRHKEVNIVVLLCVYSNLVPPEKSRLGSWYNLVYGREK